MVLKNRYLLGRIAGAVGLGYDVKLYKQILTRGGPSSPEGEISARLHKNKTRGAGRQLRQRPIVTETPKMTDSPRDWKGYKKVGGHAWGARRRGEFRGKPNLMPAFPPMGRNGRRGVWREKDWGGSFSDGRGKKQMGINGDK